MAFDIGAASAAVNPLAFVTTTGALTAYKHARMTGAPADWREAAHQLASALEAERAGMRQPARQELRVWIAPTGDTFRWGYEGGGFQFSGFPSPQAAREDALQAHPFAVLVWVEASVAVAAASAPKAARAARPSATHDLSVRVPMPPRQRQAIGAFICRWADGSETRVQAVVYHSAKLETRWAAAFQAADRLRRERAGREVAGFEALPGRYSRGPCGVPVQSEAWRQLIAVMPRPELVEILCENTVEVRQFGPGFGGGDAVAAECCLAELRRPVERGPKAKPPAVVRPAGEVVPFPIAPERLVAAQDRASAARVAHEAAQRRVAALLRPEQGPRGAGELIAAAYESECAAFVARRAAERDLQALAA